MNKHIIFTTLLAALILSPSANAASTQSYYLTATGEETKSVDPYGGTINTTINCETGVLEGTLNPTFLITTNACGDKDLDMRVTTNTTSGYTNALFTYNSVHYVVMTNSNALPPATSVANIRTGTPTATLNPNAIAYTILDPPNQRGTLQTEYIAAGDYWKLHLSKKGPVTTYTTIPTGAAFTNTFSGDDEAGPYQAVVTLSFV